MYNVQVSVPSFSGMSNDPTLLARLGNYFERKRDLELVRPSTSLVFFLCICNFLQKQHEEFLDTFNLQYKNFVQFLLVIEYLFLYYLDSIWLL